MRTNNNDKKYPNIKFILSDVSCLMSYAMSCLTSRVHIIILASVEAFNFIYFFFLFKALLLIYYLFIYLC